MRLKKIALTAAATLLVLVGAVTFMPLRAIAGLETPCNYISDLVATNPLSSDLASTGDDHLRCIKLALKTTFPNVNGAVSATDEVLSAASATNVANVFTATSQEFENAAWRLLFDETDAASNERLYDIAASSGQLLARTRTDADAAGNTWLTVDRTGTTVDSIALAGTAITLNGVAATDFARLSQANTFTQSGTTILLSSANPRLDWNETDAASDNKRWYASVNSETFSFGTINDSLGSAADAITINRTGVTVDSINLQATAVYVPDGSASTPGASFSGDTDTGMFRAGSNNLAFATNGVTRLAMDTTGVYIGDGLTDVPMGIPDGITAPSTVAGFAYIYVDSSDGDLKIKFGDGTVKTITTDSP